jgi:hypothetical protein
MRVSTGKRNYHTNQHHKCFRLGVKNCRGSTPTFFPDRHTSVADTVDLSRGQNKAVAGSNQYGVNLFDKQKPLPPRAILKRPRSLRHTDCRRLGPLYIVHPQNTPVHIVKKTNGNLKVVGTFQFIWGFYHCPVRARKFNWMPWNFPCWVGTIFSIPVSENSNPEHWICYRNFGNFTSLDCTVKNF